MTTFAEISEKIFSGITPKSGGDAYTQGEQGVVFVKSGCLSDDGVLYLDETSRIKEEIHNGIMKSSQLKKDDVLIAIVGATIGKIGLFSFDREANINQAIAGVRLKKEGFLPQFVIAYLSSNIGQTYLDFLKRPVARANINLQEIAQIEIPVINKVDQIKLISILNNAKEKRITKKKHVIEYTNTLRKNLLAKIGVEFEDYRPALFSSTKLRYIKQLGLFCNPHTAYLNHVFSVLQNCEYSSGVLKDYVHINPRIDKKSLGDSNPVSFVPMQNVGERNNKVSYETKEYREVKVGFTPFMKGDLLWAKITPCMQNGKSFIASDMPTEYGFGSTEFHVIRAKDERLYIPFLWMLLSDPHILEAAQGMFSGSAGQQRVTEEFLKNFPIVMPPYGLQKELADEVLDSLVIADKLESEAEKEWQEARKQFENELLKG